MTSDEACEVAGPVAMLRALWRSKRHDWNAGFNIDSRIYVPGQPDQFVIRHVVSCSKCGQWRTLATLFCPVRILQENRDGE